MRHRDKKSLLLRCVKHEKRCFHESRFVACEEELYMISLGFDRENKKLYSFASALALITIAYNIIEGAVSVLFGLEDGSMVLPPRNLPFGPHGVPFLRFPSAPRGSPRYLLP